ncbi:unnamed protein product [Meloidogyne enterolobii]|uniref:Uncharacterized protein n=1 Tax=Meloidogyne enterolobii TaxID=390850 RepID=A0ACB1AG91_MELEN
MAKNSFALTENNCVDKESHQNGEKLKKRTPVSFKKFCGPSRSLVRATSTDDISHMTIVDLFGIFKNNVSLQPLLAYFKNIYNIQSNNLMAKSCALQKYNLQLFDGFGVIQELQFFLYLLDVHEQIYSNGGNNKDYKKFVVLDVKSFQNIEALAIYLDEVDCNFEIRYPNIFEIGGGYVSGVEFIAKLSSILRNAYKNRQNISTSFDVWICKCILKLIFLMRLRDIVVDLTETVRNQSRALDRQSEALDRQSEEIQTLRTENERKDVEIARLRQLLQANNQPQPPQQQLQVIPVRLPLVNLPQQHHANAPQQQAIHGIPPQQQAVHNIPPQQQAIHYPNQAAPAFGQQQQNQQILQQQQFPPLQGADNINLDELLNFDNLER